MIIDKKPDIDKTEENGTSVEYSTTNIPGTVGMGYTSTFNISRGGEINGDLYYQHAPTGYAHDTQGRPIPDSQLTFVWSTSSTGPTVPIVASAANSAIGRLYAKNLPTGTFKLTVTVYIQSHPHVKGSVTITVNVL